jgi:ADP-heptose:LPS heptosyltransferase
MVSTFSPRILVIAIRAIGDIVLITPLLSLLKKDYPSGYLAVLADGSTVEALKHNPHIDRIIPINRFESKKQSWWKRGTLWLNLVADLRNERFDVVVDIFSGSRSAILAYLSGATDRYGEDSRNHGRGFLYNHPIKIFRDGRHLIEQKMDLIRPLIGQVEIRDAVLELFLTDQERSQGRQWLGGMRDDKKRRIGFIPSAGSKWRVWPSERFAELGEALAAVYGAEIVLLGGADDVSICQHIGALMRTKSLDLSGKTTLRELVAVLAELDLVIANVTGPMHLAVAVSQPKVIGLYGAADTVQYAPWGTQGIMLTQGTPQDAYWYKVDYQKDYDMLCQITVAEVLHRVKTVMSDWRVCP